MGSASRPRTCAWIPAATKTKAVNSAAPWPAAGSMNASALACVQKVPNGRTVYIHFEPKIVSNRLIPHSKPACVKIFAEWLTPDLPACHILS